eukprot:CAMPEP_0197906574 /NCGR_PEP_ID=MMETSP1439-20131203/62991_1 /TAXON_ID=66791 /ORGANISM="Gonyaulax spinifera, Strain CCMP409" /LENGTH=219 /DNA_ID=CAMNT_0043527945 /DNA_START=27 /DNA_END=686 /DNA_ORIENTATION=+
MAGHRSEPWLCQGPDGPRPVMHRRLSHSDNDLDSLYDSHWSVFGKSDGTGGSGGTGGTGSSWLPSLACDGVIDQPDADYGLSDQQIDQAARACGHHPDSDYGLSEWQLQRLLRTYHPGGAWQEHDTPSRHVQTDTRGTQTSCMGPETESSWCPDLEGYGRAESNEFRPRQPGAGMKVLPNREDCCAHRGGGKKCRTCRIGMLCEDPMDVPDDLVIYKDY